MIEHLFGQLHDKQVNQDAMKYSLITRAIALVHVVFCMTFFAMHIYSFTIYNVVVVCMYIFFSHNLSNFKNLILIYFIYITEIILHASLASVFVGWNYGFMFYLISLIPVSFYMAFSISSFKRNLFYPFFTTIVLFIDYIVVRVITHFFEPVYSTPQIGYELFLCITNIIIAIFATFLFSALFAVEVNSMQLMLEKENEKLEDQATFDPLTHFLNRRSMDEKIANAHRNAIINDSTYSVIMCDIDHFKKFNDTYGHDCGDFVLQTLSKIILGQIRVNDAACRWGGEEFLILISGDKASAADIAERIRAAIDNYEFYYSGQTLHVTITLGVSTYYPSSKVKTLIEIADKRLYKGKENGRNQVVST